MLGFVPAAVIGLRALAGRIQVSEEFPLCVRGVLNNIPDQAELILPTFGGHPEISYYL